MSTITHIMNTTAAAPTHLANILDGDLHSTTIMAATLLVLLFGTIVSFFYSTSSTVSTNNNKNQTNKKEKYATPWPKVEGALPIIGNFHQIKDPKYLPAKANEWARDLAKEHGCYEIRLAGVRWVVLCNEERMREVMAERPFKVIRSRKVTAATSSVGGDGAFSAEGDLWKMNRKVLAPMFNKNHIRDYFQYMKIVNTRLIKRWSSFANGDGFAINEDVFKYTMDFSALASLGKELDSLNRESIEAKDMVTIFEGMGTRALAPFQFWKIPIIGQYLDGLGYPINRMITLFGDVIDNFIQNGPSEEGDGSLVGKLVEQAGRDPTFERKYMIGNLTTALMAGTDSTASTICTVLQHLVEDNTGIQEEIRKEIDANLPDNLDDITLDDLSLENVPILKSFIIESSRFCPAFPLFLYEVDEDIDFCGTTLPKGVNILANFQYTTLNPIDRPKGVLHGPNGEYPDNTEFHPRRWLVKDDKSKSGYVCAHPEKNSTAYLTFGHGRRQCPGQAFANTFICYTMVNLLRRYRLDKADGYESAGREFLLANIPDKDIRITLTKRE